MLLGDRNKWLNDNSLIPWVYSIYTASMSHLNYHCMRGKGKETRNRVFSIALGYIHANLFSYSSVFYPTKTDTQNGYRFRIVLNRPHQLWVNDTFSVSLGDWLSSSWRHSFRRPSFSAFSPVDTNTKGIRFRKSPSWKAFSKASVFVG